MNAMAVRSGLPPQEISFGNDTSIAVDSVSKPSSFITSKSNCNAISTIPIPSGPRGAAIPRKPMRPLTAYHIFFQIEREYIIQTLPDDANTANDDDKVTSNKTTLQDVPDRYKEIKLSPDWYFGPGKRPKRKHRKAHGKVGFMELSRIIASRWAELDTLDPEVKEFVQKLAKQELDEYTVDMKRYKEVTRGMQLPTSAVASTASTRSQDKKKTSAPAVPAPTSNKRLRLALKQPIAPISMPPQGNYAQQPIDLTDEIDYFISRINNDARHLLPPPRQPMNDTRCIYSASVHYPRPERRNSLLTFLEPLFDTVELEQDTVIHEAQEMERQGEEEVVHCHKKQRRNSPSTVAVDIHDDEIIRMWKENNVR
ncbi:hypothetical protein ACHAWO_005424 [Cyclotella atomus]|uniref:HMG box domain-containing protein n=1 Tax=Cyclotella atomus TaxID=382360 RepID=A0ABD3QCC1_9STRA